MENLSLKFLYRGRGYPLELTLEEAGLVTHCQVTTLHPLQHMVFESWPDAIHGKIIMESDILTEMWLGLDNSSQTLDIRISDREPLLTLATKSEHGSVTTIDRDDEKVKTIKMRIPNTACSNVYDMSLLRMSLRALMPSDKTSIQMSSNGTICIQFMLQLNESVKAFVEYNCTALVEDRDDDSD